MPKDNWYLEQNPNAPVPDFIPDDAYVEKRQKGQDINSPERYVAPVREKDLPQAGFGWAPTMGAPDFVPDAEYKAKKALSQITPEQEKYGLEWKPGDPMVPPKRKKRKGSLNPWTGEWDENLTK